MSHSGEHETFALQVIRLAAPSIQNNLDSWPPQGFVLGPASRLKHRALRVLAQIEDFDYFVTSALLGTLEQLFKERLPCYEPGIVPVLFLGLDTKVRFYPVTRRLLATLIGENRVQQE